MKYLQIVVFYFSSSLAAASIGDCKTYGHCFGQNVAYYFKKYGKLCDELCSNRSFGALQVFCR
jgi:hypothetical protein